MSERSDSDGMDNHPTLPDSFYAPVALVLEPHELTALHDAILVYDLLADGCLVDALALVDKTDDGGYTDGIVRTLLAVKAKIERAEEPSRRQIRRWYEEIEARRDERLEE